MGRDLSLHQSLHKEAPTKLGGVCTPDSLETFPPFQTSAFRKAAYFKTMAKDISLWWGSGSPPCWRVQIALAEKGLEGYNSRLLSFEKGEHKSKEVTDVNPRGQLPAFKHGNIIINESFGICEYIEETFKSQGNQLIPDCPKEKALMRQRMHEGNSLMMKFADVCFYTWRVPEAERHESACVRNRAALCDELKLWDGYLQKSGPYLAGKSFSLADVIVFPVVAFLFRMGLCQKEHKKLAEYYNLLKDRPSIKNTWPPTWKDTPGQEVLKDIKCKH